MCYNNYRKHRMSIKETDAQNIQQVNPLEQELGLTLFERTHRGIELTKAGRSVYGDAKYLIRYSKDSITRAKNAMQGEEKTIRIGILL